MNFQRASRVAEQVRSNLARTITKEMRDPAVGFVTITDVKLSPDLRHATVFVTVMPFEQREHTVAALNRAVPFLRRSLAREGGLRFTPQLRFCYDEAFASGQRVDDILRTIHDEASGVDGPPSGDAENGED
jgi:ribosome-binding factor A